MKLCLNFFCGIFNNLISIYQVFKKPVLKTQFYINKANYLNNLCNNYTYYVTRKTVPGYLNFKVSVLHVLLARWAILEIKTVL